MIQTKPADSRYPQLSANRELGAYP